MPIRPFPSSACCKPFAGRDRRAVMPREGGASSTPRPPDFTAPALEYWIARLRGRRRLGCDAGDRNDPVIASEAKQSIAQRQDKSGFLTWGFCMSRISLDIFVPVPPPLRHHRGLCRLTRE